MDSSTLGRLSAELRNVIYSLVLSADKPISLTTDRPYGKLRLTELEVIEGSVEEPLKQPVAIAAVCRQMRSEATQMFYHVNSFDIRYTTQVNSYHRDEARLLQKFCDTIGSANVSALRHVTLTFNRYRYELEWVGTENRRHIKHQLLALRAFAAKHSKCRLVVRIEWRDDADDRNNPRRIKFRVNAANEGISKATTTLESYQDFYEARRGVYAALKAYKSGLLQEILEEIMTESASLSDAANKE